MGTQTRRDGGVNDPIFQLHPTQAQGRKQSRVRIFSGFRDELHSIEYERALYQPPPSKTLGFKPCELISQERKTSFIAAGRAKKASPCGTSSRQQITF
jgi:hypothetical protein